MNKLLAYDWPGNIRELQNVVERAVILARGEVVRAEFLPLVSGGRAVPSLAPAVLTPSERPAPPRSPAAPVVPFSDAERAAILRALDMTAWRISGNGGAAQVLGLKPTTLHAKMKKLGIRRPSVPAAV